MTYDSILLPPAQQETTQPAVDEKNGSQAPGPRHPAKPAASPLRGRARVVVTVILVTLAVLIAALVWVGVRGLMAANSAFTAGTAASELQQHLDDGDLGRARESVDLIQTEARQAATLTSDPVWRALEFIPTVGSNLTAIRTGVGSLETIAVDGLDPLVALSTSVEIPQLLTSSRVDRLSGLNAAEPSIAELDEAVRSAVAALDSVDDSSTIEPVAEAFSTLRTELHRYAAVTSGLSAISHLGSSQVAAEPDTVWTIVVSSGYPLETTAHAVITATTGANGFAISRVAGPDTQGTADSSPLTISVESLSFLLTESGPQSLPATRGGDRLSAEELEALLVVDGSPEELTNAHALIGTHAAGLLTKLVG
ncbi:MAG: hypothetical protein ABWY23_04915 [Mycetocola sp.]